MSGRWESWLSTPGHSQHGTSCEGCQRAPANDAATMSLPPCFCRGTSPPPSPPSGAGPACGHLTNRRWKKQLCVIPGVSSTGSTAPGGCLLGPGLSAGLGGHAEGTGPWHARKELSRASGPKDPHCDCTQETPVATHRTWREHNTLLPSPPSFWVAIDS